MNTKLLHYLIHAKMKIRCFTITDSYRSKKRSLYYRFKANGISANTKLRTSKNEQIKKLK